MAKAKSFSKLGEAIERDPVRRARAEKQLLAVREAVTLAELREVLATRQEDIANALRKSQANVSRIEHQDDAKLSTIKSYVAALGGHLELSAVFPDATVKLEIGYHPPNRNGPGFGRRLIGAQN
jgi:Helix-turn-helix domain